MAQKTFSINEDPHVANIGESQLLFLPEVIGTDFAEGYAKLVEVQERVNGGRASKASSTKHAKADSVDPAVLRELNEAMREFLSGLMLPDSQKIFAVLRLPDRILVDLLKWVSELYGGGSGGNDDGGSSTD